MEASGVIHNWKKMPHSPFPGGFECCTCGCAAGLIAAWFPEPRGSLVAGEGVIQDGRCSTRSCARDLRRQKGASVAQPTEASPTLPISGSGGFHKVFPKEREADGSRGHIPCHCPSSKAWRCPFQGKGAHPFPPPVPGGWAGSTGGFLPCPLLLTQTSEGPVILAVGQRCWGNSSNKKGSSERHWFCLNTKTTSFTEKKGRSCGRRWRMPHRAGQVRWASRAWPGKGPHLLPRGFCQADWCVLALTGQPQRLT